MRTFYSLALVSMALTAYAQNYEFGAHGGASFYDSTEVTTSSGSADAGFKFGYGAGATLGHDMYERIGGELRYTFLKNDLKVTSSGTEDAFGGQAHALHYDILVHASSRRSRVRPYAAFGGGFKYYRGTGTEMAFRPLEDFAIPTRTSEIQGMISIGGGVKFAVSERVLFRVDVHDYLTPFPKEVLAPAPGASLGGWVHNIVPTVGVAFRF
jgi:hypothetical protein